MLYPGYLLCIFFKNYFTLGENYYGRKFNSVGNELFKSIKNIFPPHAEFEYKLEFDTKKYVMRIDWKLENDPTRPNKSSKIILILLTPEALEYYQTLSPMNKQKAQDRLHKIITENYEKFDPEHTASIFDHPPLEKWGITTQWLNGLF